MADYCIARHYPELTDNADRYVDFLRAVIDRQAALIAQWMGIGFIHGVMNTDNMSIAGDTIDYGPCAFMEAYDAKAVFSSIDEQGRYSYENQPHIAQWNLARLAEALLPLLSDNEQNAFDLASALIESFADIYSAYWLTVMRAKLGLNAPLDHAVDDAADFDLVNEWLSLLQTNQVDFTGSWRKLGDAADGNLSPLRHMFANQTTLNVWLVKWQARCTKEDTALLSKGTFVPDLSTRGGLKGLSRAERIRKINPWLIPRNHRVEEALAAASEQDNLAPFNQLLAALSSPYRADEDLTRFAESAPSKFTTNYRTFCGT